MKWIIYSELARSRKSAVLSVIFAVLAVGIFVLIALASITETSESCR